MSYFVEIDGDPNEMRKDANSCATAGGEVVSPVNAALARIKAIEAKKSWGTDEYGKSFSDQYFKASDDGSTANDSVQSGCGQMGPQLKDIGDRVVTVVDAYTSTDSTGGSDIRQVKGSIQDLYSA